MTDSRSMWNNVASYYDAVWEVADYSPILKAINRETKASSAGTILDVATGTGIVALDLARRTLHKGEVIGLDASRSMLKKAMEKAKATAFHNVQFILGDAHNLPFISNAFDLIILWQIMEYLRDPWQAMKEIHRVLKPRGVIIGSVSFLEPMHGKVFFNFSQYGIEEILKESRFTNILLSPGIGCFPLICWTWVRQLTGSELLAEVGLWVERIGIWGVCGILDLLSEMKHALGLGDNFKRHWIREIMPFSYAGQITFRATKGEDT